MAKVFFLTHPDVLIDKSIPVPQWRLSDEGKLKANIFAQYPFVKSIKKIFSSLETKSVEAAQIIGSKLQVNPECLSELGEIDRSATGYLEKKLHDKAVIALFKYPQESYSGWETAARAQKRITAVVNQTLDQNQAVDGDILIVSHGAVGAFLLAFLLKQPISQELEQPSMGSYFVFDKANRKVLHKWRSIKLLKNYQRLMSNASDN